MIIVSSVHLRHSHGNSQLCPSRFPLPASSSYQGWLQCCLNSRPFHCIWQLVRIAAVEPGHTRCEQLPTEGPWLLFGSRDAVLYWCVKILTNVSAQAIIILAWDAGMSINSVRTSISDESVSNQEEDFRVEWLVIRQQQTGHRLFRTRWREEKHCGRVVSLITLRWGLMAKYKVLYVKFPIMNQPGINKVIKIYN